MSLLPKFQLRFRTAVVTFSMGVFGYYCLKKIWTAYLPIAIRKKQSMNTVTTGTDSSISSTSDNTCLKTFLKDVYATYGDQRKIHILYPDVLEKKLQRFLCGGADSLEIVSDFDRTLSKVLHNGAPVPTCHGVLECNPDFSETAKAACDELRNKYYPIEIDPTMQEEEKIPYMEEWWSKAHSILSLEHIHESTLRKVVVDSGLVLRTGVDTFFKRLHEMKIPVLIFSAGIGNVIDQLLQHLNLHFDNVKIVSNFMTFNSQGILVGFQSDIIHSCNKTVKSIVRSEFYDEVCSKRKNIILLGDSTGDVRMVQEESDESNTIIRIGFLNHQVETLLPLYKDLYDVVLVNDDTFDFSNMLLDFITKTL